MRAKALARFSKSARRNGSAGGDNLLPLKPDHPRYSSCGQRAYAMSHKRRPLYDHVPPPYEDFDGLGFRVPLLVISPYAKHDHVSHVQYETASVLRFAEDLFGLGRLAAADKRAASPAGDCFDFGQAPRPFVKIKAPEPAKFFMNKRFFSYFAPDYE
jgi:hypothetical protein